uniref:Uncharacterized protein n=1 Tax=Amphimedon queenslandica TaxID=400682 RepID=A0A1X7TKZ8_AMPQE
MLSVELLEGVVAPVITDELLEAVDPVEVADTVLGGIVADELLGGVLVIKEVLLGAEVVTDVGVVSVMDKLLEGVLVIIEVLLGAEVVTDVGVVSVMDKLLEGVLVIIEVLLKAEVATDVEVILGGVSVVTDELGVAVTSTDEVLLRVMDTTVDDNMVLSVVLIVAAVSAVEVIITKVVLMTGLVLVDEVTLDATETTYVKLQ